ncbi:hypothetical protein GCM10009087_16170 [Sphingomonas oligophenolica]|uniref:Uncharacterized protein n=1 Tax=Sphingomonas oligophenolica TaxID=301154 RepID=A0ABU9Y7V1_9SPHN
MTKTLLAAALFASLAAPAFASDTPAERTFTRDGETYVYTTQIKTDRVVITGRSHPDGGPFELVVRGDSVTGFSGGIPVSFFMKGVQAKLMPAKLAAR